MAKANDCAECVYDGLVQLAIEAAVFVELIPRIAIKIVNNPTQRALGWTDGSKIYVNETIYNEFCENPIVETADGKKINRHVDKYAMIFLLAHELMHLIGLTYDRGTQKGIVKGAFDKKSILKWQTWNKATDYEINSMLHHNESANSMGQLESKPIGKLPEYVLYDPKYKDKTAEEIYDELMKENENNGNDPEFNEDYDGGDPGNATGNVVDGLDFGLDDHVPFVDDTTRNEVISRISEVFGSTSNGLGCTAMDRLINRVFKPEPFNWRKALTKYIRSYMKANYTWNKPSRAGIANGIILPSAGQTPKLKIACAVDTSGSISNKELDTMVNHLFTILTQFKSFEVDVWCCGSKVYEETLRTYTEQNKRELANFPIKSDGGNDMRENFKFLKEHYKGKDKLDLFLLLSDFYDPLDGDTETTSPCPVICMVIDHPDFVPPSKMKCEVYPYTVDNKGR